MIHPGLCRRWHKKHQWGEEYPTDNGTFFGQVEKRCRRCGQTKRRPHLPEWYQAIINRSLNEQLKIMEELRKLSTAKSGTVKFFQFQKTEAK